MALLAISTYARPFIVTLHYVPSSSIKLLPRTMAEEQDPEALKLQGNDMHKAMEYAEAITLYLRAASLKPDVAVSRVPQCQ